MANHVGQKLSRLIRQRAYVAGHRSKVLADLGQVKAQMRGLKAEINRTERKIAELDEEIALLSVIDPSDIKEIRSMPRTIVFRHGTFRREMINFLKNAGRPVSTKEILDHMATLFEIPMNTSSDRKKARDAVRRPLNIFHEAGAVLRLESHEDSKHGVWCWADGYKEGAEA